MQDTDFFRAALGAGREPWYVKVVSMDVANKRVEAVVMDMRPTYLKAVKDKLPQAQVVHDKFHVSKYLNEALDAVRKLGHRGLMAQGNRSLSGTEYA